MLSVYSKVKNNNVINSNFIAVSGFLFLFTFLLFCNTVSADNTGSISISSSPSGASISIDPNPFVSYPVGYDGYTPDTISDLTPGSHIVKLTKTGYVEYYTTVMVYAGQITTVSANLIPTSTMTTTGTLYVRSSPSGASVYVNGSYQGTTPKTLTDQTTGSHTVRLSKYGYTDYSTTATVHEGQTITVKGYLSQISTPPPTFFSTTSSDTPQIQQTVSKNSSQEPSLIEIIKENSSLVLITIAFCSLILGILVYYKK